MEERSQLVPLNLCSSAFLLGEMKSMNSAFLQTPPPLQPLQTSQSSHRPGDMEMSLCSRTYGGYCLPSGGTSILLPDYRIQQKTAEEEPKPNFSYIGKLKTWNKRCYTLSSIVPSLLHYLLLKVLIWISLLKNISQR